MVCHLVVPHNNWVYLPVTIWTCLGQELGVILDLSNDNSGSNISLLHSVSAGKFKAGTLK